MTFITNCRYGNCAATTTTTTTHWLKLICSTKLANGKKEKEASELNRFEFVLSIFLYVDFCNLFFYCIVQVLGGLFCVIGLHKINCQRNFTSGNRFHCKPTQFACLFEFQWALGFTEYFNTFGLCKLFRQPNWRKTFSIKSNETHKMDCPKQVIVLRLVFVLLHFRTFFLFFQRADWNFDRKVLAFLAAYHSPMYSI